jgi:hypothetical protein
VPLCISAEWRWNRRLGRTYGGFSPWCSVAGSRILRVKGGLRPLTATATAFVRPGRR